MKFSELDIPGCYLIDPFYQEDARGCFMKTFHSGEFQRHGLPLSLKEEFISISRKNVLRGMHFQIPPEDQDKLIYCLNGTVLDGFVDLRRGSPAYKKSQTITLSGRNRKILFLPRGIAHGFFTLSDEATMVYKTSSLHHPRFDTGISWRSCGIQWPSQHPVLSDRDKGFPDLNAFNSPFRYEPI